MNAIDLLKVDHRVVDALFTQAESMQPSKRGPVYKKISNELAAHAHVEETIFYPALKKKGNQDLVKIVLEGIEEHGQIHMFHDQLDTMQPSEERFEPKLTVLHEDIRHHVKEEEGEMFNLAEDQFSSEELEQLGEQMQAEKLRFQKEKGIPKRTAKDEELGQSMMARMVNAVTGMFSSGEGEEDEQGSGRSSSGGKAKASSGRSSKSAASKSGGASKTTAGKSSTGGAKSPGSGRSANGKSSGGSGSSAKSSSSSTKSKSSSTKSSSSK
jgi:hypothetical protein